MQIDAPALWADWTSFWNDDPDIATRIITDVFRAHALNDDQADGIRDRAGLIAWRNEFVAARSGLRFHTAGRPMLDGDQLACRWYATVRDAEGRPIAKAGIDVLRLEGPRIAEVWTVSGARILDPEELGLG
jgi:hypothetical protein